VRFVAQRARVRDVEQQTAFCMQTRLAIQTNRTALAAVPSVLAPTPIGRDHFIDVDSTPPHS
jgi:hypothetical protein